MSCTPSLTFPGDRRQLFLAYADCLLIVVSININGAVCGLRLAFPSRRAACPKRTLPVSKRTIWIAFWAFIRFLPRYRLGCWVLGYTLSHLCLYICVMFVSLPVLSLSLFLGFSRLCLVFDYSCIYLSCLLFFVSG